VKVQILLLRHWSDFEILDELSLTEMLRAVISAGTQNADIKKQYTRNQLDVVVDSARLFDRSDFLLSVSYLYWV